MAIYLRNESIMTPLSLSVWEWLVQSFFHTTTRIQWTHQSSENGGITIAANIKWYLLPPKCWSFVCCQNSWNM